jgi:hypothetical protein
MAGASTIAMLVFTALTMNWMRVRMKPWEWPVLALAVVFMFRPDFFMDQLAAEHKSVPAAQAFAVAGQLPAGERLLAVIGGTTLEGKALTKTVAVNLSEANPDGRKRLAAAGLTLAPLGDRMQVMGVKFGSAARKSGFEEGFDVVELKVPSGRASPHWFYLPGMMLIVLVWVGAGGGDWRRRRHDENHSPSLRSTPPVAVGGEGVWLIDADGKRYLDASGGAAVSCLGHGHPDVLAAMHAQIDRLA